MKRLLLSSAIIGLFVCLAALHVNHLGNLTDELIGQLETIRTDVERENWSAAAATTSEISAKWAKHAFYLHTTRRHTDIDEILSSLRELDAFLDSREDKAETLSVIARLINQLELLVEAELPSIKNLL